MIIVNITDREQYNRFVGNQKHSRFLQSWEWGEFQQAVGHDVRRLAVADDEEELLAAAILIKNDLPLGRAYFIVHTDRLLMRKE